MKGKDLLAGAAKSASYNMLLQVCRSIIMRINNALDDELTGWGEGAYK